MIKKIVYLLGLSIVLCVSLQDKYLNAKMQDSFIEKVTYYTKFGNMQQQPYWIVLLIFICVLSMIYVYKKNSR